jgi:hypothetical protein
MNKRAIEHNVHISERPISKPSSEELGRATSTELSYIEGISADDTVVIHKMKKPDDAVGLHKILEDIFGE